jgi:hypothetical protein
VVARREHVIERAEGVGVMSLKPALAHEHVAEVEIAGLGLHVHFVSVAQRPRAALADLVHVERSDETFDARNEMGI